MRTISLALAAALFSGCAFTQGDLIKEMAPLYQKQAAAQMELAKAVMTALASTRRGGMDIELDENKSIKAIHYREHLDLAALQKLFAPQRLPVPHAPAQDYAALFMGLGSIVTPFASMYFNYRTHKVDSDNAAAVRMNENMAQNFNWDMFTGRFKHESPAWMPEYMMPKEEPEGGEK